jgi:hypothetical protein
MPRYVNPTRRAVQILRQSYELLLLDFPDPTERD